MVCYDDLDLQPGVIRMRPAGSSGGHNGIKSIDSHLGTQSYPRLRLGIGRGEKEVIQHVLSDFTDSEKVQLERVFDEVERALHTWSRAGLEKAMSLHNGKVSDLG
jgi:PTH1 family peptidyl-tRNA hydrolase